MSRWIVLPILAIAAIAFYSMGNVSSLFICVIIGFMFEMAFWFKAFPKKKKKP